MSFVAMVDIFLTGNKATTNVTGPGEVVGNVTGPTDVERVLVPILDAIILATGLAGHVLVIVVICRTLKRRGSLRGTGQPNANANANGTDFLLLSLSVADLLLLSCIPYHTVAIATRHWPFGYFLCKGVSFLGALCTSASAFTLAALAFSRYVIVVHPTKAYRWRRDRRMKLVTAALWAPAVVLAIPQLAWRTLQSTGPAPRSSVARQDLMCFSFLSDADQLAYGVCHFLLAFALPLGVIAVAYGMIYRFLRKTRQAREGQSDRLERYQAQVTHISVLLVLAFALCWLPSYGLMLAQLAGGSSVTGPSPRYGPFATFARVMATSSTVVNPVLYVFMSEKFRKELRELLKSRSCCRDASS